MRGEGGKEEREGRKRGRGRGRGRGVIWILTHEKVCGMSLV